MPAITSAELDAFATFPQCADNQFLPASTLSGLYEGTITLKQALRDREAAVRREYMRALVYSPEVVLNRAFAVNEQQIFRDVAADPESVARLVEDRRLTIQLLGSESGLGQVIEGSTFDRSADGVTAWRRFLVSYGDDSLRYLKLSGDESTAVTKRFPSMVRQLLRVDEMEDAELEGIFGAVVRDGGGPERLNQFREFLRETGEPWVRGKKPAELYRNDFYKKFVLPDGADAASLAIDPGKPFAYELKLIADLAYNNNIPATLLRQSFIPMDLPNPLCLPAELYGRRIGDSSLRREVASGVIDQMLAEPIAYRSQEAFLVPEWAELGVQDVIEIHSWPEWRQFDESFRSLVDAVTPDNFGELLSRFSLALEVFHGRLSREIESHSAVSSLRRLRNGARLLLLVVHPILTWGGHAVGLHELAAIASEAASGAGVEFGLDLGIGFLEGRHHHAHGEEIEQFQLRAAGVRKNLCAEIAQTASHAAEIERHAEPADREPRTPRSEAQIA